MFCGCPRPPEEMEYEIEEVERESRRTFRFHLHCHGVWQVELTGPHVT